MYTSMGLCRDMTLPSIFSQKKYVRLLGLRNTCTNGNEWYRLLFYEFDGELDIELLKSVINKEEISYVLYKTKHGYHLVGLSVLDVEDWARIFAELSSVFHSYYSGSTIRLSMKYNEQQELVILHRGNDEIIPNLYNIYARRFNMMEIPVEKPYRIRLSVERYTSVIKQ